MPPVNASRPDATRGGDPAVGLCAECAQCHRVASARGATFFLCRRAATEPAYARYPRLPVTWCQGFVPLPVDALSPARR